MKTQTQTKLSDLKLNDGSHGLPKNPRFIRDERFKKLCESIRDFPEAMPARGIVVDERGVILGGNMRYRACLENGMKEIPASWVHRLTGLTTEQKRRFIIMDNRAFGDDDMDLLGNEWDMAELINAGFSESDLTGLEGAIDLSDKDAAANPDTVRCPKCGFAFEGAK
jgi:ParB-like chromosome segregation protein Spo0J